jgi:hypothetical protein
LRSANHRVLNLENETLLGFTASHSLTSKHCRQTHAADINLEKIAEGAHTRKLREEMDWARDATGISDNDYRNVYKYEEKHTTVVQMTTGEKVRTTPCLWLALN